MEIADAVRKDTPEIMEKILTAIQEEDLSSLELFAHRVKGSTAALGALTSSQITAEMEQAGKNQDLETAQSLIDCLQKEVDELISFINETDWLDRAQEQTRSSEKNYL